MKYSKLYETYKYTMCEVVYVNSKDDLKKAVTSHVKDWQKELLQGMYIEHDHSQYICPGYYIITGSYECNEFIIYGHYIIKDTLYGAYIGLLEYIQSFKRYIPALYKDFSYLWKGCNSIFMLRWRHMWNCGCFCYSKLIAKTIPFFIKLLHAFIINKYMLFYYSVNIHIKTLKESRKEDQAFWNKMLGIS